MGPFGLAGRDELGLVLNVTLTSCPSSLLIGSEPWPQVMLSTYGGERASSHPPGPTAYSEMWRKSCKTAFLGSNLENLPVLPPSRYVLFCVAGSAAQTLKGLFELGSQLAGLPRTRLQDQPHVAHPPPER